MNAKISVLRYISVLSEYVIPLYLAIAFLSYFLVKPPIFSVVFIRKFFGDPIYTSFGHALFSYHLSIIVASLLFLVISFVEIKGFKDRTYEKYRLLKGWSISSFSFLLDGYFSSIRLTYIDSISSVLVPRFGVFVVCLITISLLVKCIQVAVARFRLK